MLKLMGKNIYNFFNQTFCLSKLVFLHAYSIKIIKMVEKLLENKKTMVNSSHSLKNYKNLSRV